MATKEQVKHQIKFFIDQMGSQNAHHDFEHLCRHLARARICSNILPATGPVTSGGDQGADFETFRSNIAATLGNGAFVGLVSDKKTSFSCTIQTTDLEGKIKSDINKMANREFPPERVVYFTIQSVSV